MRILMASSQVVEGRPPLLRKRAKSDAKPVRRTSDEVHLKQPPLCGVWGLGYVLTFLGEEEKQEYIPRES